VICTSADCPIYYRRTARQKEVAGAVAQLDRFEKEAVW
jgi:DNA polymerase delta subunit 1